MFVTMLYNIWFLVLKNHISEPQEKETHHFILSRQRGHTTMTLNNKIGILSFAMTTIFGTKMGVFAFAPQKRKLLTEWITTKVRSNSAFREVDIDIDRAQDCASHFGECPVEMIEELRDGKFQAVAIITNRSSRIL